MIHIKCCSLDLCLAEAGTADALVLVTAVKQPKDRYFLNQQ